MEVDKLILISIWKCNTPMTAKFHKGKEYLRWFSNTYQFVL